MVSCCLMDVALVLAEYVPLALPNPGGAPRIQGGVGSSG